MWGFYSPSYRADSCVCVRACVSRGGGGLVKVVMQALHAGVCHVPPLFASLLLLVDLEEESQNLSVGGAAARCIRERLCVCSPPRFIRLHTTRKRAVNPGAYVIKLFI